MRYLRMLSNALIAAGVASGYLTVLVLQLNPAIQIGPGTLAPLAVMFAVAYGANLTVAFYALIVLRQILAVEVLSPGWLSVRLLSWLCAIASSGGATLMWLNLRGLGDVLDPLTRERMALGAGLVTVSAVMSMIPASPLAVSVASDEIAPPDPRVRVLVSMSTPPASPMDRVRERMLPDPCSVMRSAATTIVPPSPPE